MKNIISIIAVLIFAATIAYACKCKISTNFIKASALAEDVVYGVAVEQIFSNISHVSTGEADKQCLFKIVNQFKGEISREKIIVKTDIYLETGKYYVLALDKNNECMVCENSVLKFDKNMTEGKIDSDARMTISKDNLFRLMEHLFPADEIGDEVDDSSK